MNRTSKIIITILSVVTVIAIIVGVYFHVFRGRSFPVFSGSGKAVSDSLSFSGDLKALRVETDIGDLNIRTGKTLNVDYTLPENLVPKVSYNGILEIVSRSSSFSLPVGAGNDHYHIDITIPEGTDLDGIAIELDAGNIDLNGVNSDSLQIDLDMGNIKVNSCEADTFRAEVDAGNIDLTGCRIDRITADVDAGNIEASDCTIHEGSCETDLGNITLSGDIGDVRTETSLGNVKVN